MMAWLLMLTLILPLVICCGLLIRGRVRTISLLLAPLSAMPAVALAMSRDPVEPVTLDWLLLGTTLGLDQTGQVFLLITSVLWLIAGIYAVTYLGDIDRQHRYFFLGLLTMTGNFGLILAQDAVLFYAAFAVMTFASYGLIIYDGTLEAIRAARVYIIMAAVGEGLLLAGLVLAVHATGVISIQIDEVRAAVAESPHRSLIIALLFGGFGVKAGTIPLHVWLPLAHPVAPTPASAVLSGAMIKAGLLGWVRFFPAGEVALPGWGTAVIVIALVSAFAGAIIGTTHDNPKTVLAYSSISQMGIIATGLGVGMMEPEAWPLVITGLSLYVLHHGLVKGALFLGTGVAQAASNSRPARIAIMAGLVFSGLSLSGAPLTTGVLAKVALKEGIHGASGTWITWLDWLLPLAAAGTTIIIVRFLVVIWRTEMSAHPREDNRGLWIPWALLVVPGTGLIWLAPWYYGLDVATADAFKLSNLWTGLWPVLLGLGIFALGRHVLMETELQTRPIGIPAGDMLIPLEQYLYYTPTPAAHEIVPHPRDPLDTLGARWYGLFEESSDQDHLYRIDRWLSDWRTAGLAFLSVLVVFLALLVLQ